MRKRILFVCIGNACRSIMAEALAKHHRGDSLDVSSAGIAPLGHIAESTLAVLEEANISYQGLYSKDINEIDVSQFDLIVNLTDIPIGQYIPDSFSGKLIDHYVVDPYGRSLSSFRKARDTIEQLVTEELLKWLETL